MVTSDIDSDDDQDEDDSDDDDQDKDEASALQLQVSDDDKDCAQVGHKRKAEREIAPASTKVTKCNPTTTKAQGILISHIYNSKVKEIRQLHYVGKWNEAEKIVSELECKLPENIFYEFQGSPSEDRSELGYKPHKDISELEYRLSEDVEMYVAVSLRNCSGYVTRKRVDCVKSRVQKAKMLCKKIKSDNRVILESRCEWILAKLHRYLGEMETAQKHIDNALEMQSRIGPGEDTALGHYCQACILIRSLSEEWSDEVAECAKQHLRIASDHAVLGDYGLYISHHKIRLAQLCLRSSQYNPGRCTDEALIEAGEALTIDESKLAPRTRCMYYYTKSDLFRNMDELTEAESYAILAYKLAKKYNFTSELQAITIRFRVLKLEPPS